MNGDRWLGVVLHDAVGAPIEGAQIDLTLFHLSRPNRPIEARLEPTTVAGEYRAALPLRRSGAWRLSGVATAGADRQLIDTEAWVAPPKRDSIR